MHCLQNNQPHVTHCDTAARPWLLQVEFDLRLTADGCLVLLHDGSVDRTTNGSGAVCVIPALHAHNAHARASMWSHGRLAAVHRTSSAYAVEHVSVRTAGRWKLTHAELSDLDASNGKDGFTDVRIPTLEEALQALPSTIELNVHVNPGPADCSQLVHGVCDALREHGRQHSAFVTGNEAVIVATYTGH